MDDLDALRRLGPEAQAGSQDAERRRLARLPAHERLRLIMEQVRFHQEVQARTMSAERRASVRAKEIEEAERAWGDALP